MNTKLPPLDEQMVRRYAECVLARGVHNIPSIVPPPFTPDTQWVLKGRWVHVMYRKNGRLFCRWIPQGFVDDIQFFFDAYEESPVRGE